MTRYVVVESSEYEDSFVSYQDDGVEVVFIDWGYIYRLDSNSYPDDIEDMTYYITSLLNSLKQITGQTLHIQGVITELETALLELED